MDIQMQIQIHIRNGIANAQAHGRASTLCQGPMPISARLHQRALMQACRDASVR
jgi:hypothetical protein